MSMKTTTEDEKIDIKHKEFYLVPLEPKIINYLKKHKRDIILISVGAALGMLLTMFFVYVIIIIISFISGFFIDRYFIKRAHAKYTEKTK
ncbi:MAG: hypothetical protein GF317_05855 [Candidatus Lokiarchaeota archaeon]|nr:hypothetical protein [Candidatus Lokiarchaeota archaeon]